jgi:hypothetical protein
MVSAEREAGSEITLQSLAELTAKPVGHTPRATLPEPASAPNPHPAS